MSKTSSQHIQGVHSHSQPLLRRIGSEYSDKVIKINRKADILLELTLQLLTKQETAACNSLRQNEEEMRRMRTKIKQTKSDSVRPRTNISMMMFNRQLSLAGSRSCDYINGNCRRRLSIM